VSRPIPSVATPPAAATDQHARDGDQRGDDAVDLGRRLWWWLPPIAVTVAVQLWLAAKDTVASIDGMAYLEAGEHLFAGDGFVRQGRPETHFPPVGPVALGLLEKVTGSELAAVRIFDVASIVTVVALLD